MVSPGCLHPRHVHRANHRPREGACGHVDLLPERDTLPRGVQRPGNAPSRRNTPPSMVTMAVVAAVVLMCIGALLGATCSRRLLERRLDQEANQQAEERRTLAK